MSAPVIKFHYENMATVGQKFKALHDKVQTMQSRINSSMEELRGEFKGEAADKFFEEMESSVMPRIQRLVASLDHASSGVNQLHSIMSNAEQHAGGLFK